MSNNRPPARALPVPANRFRRIGHLGAMTAGVASNMAANGIVQLGKGQRPAFRDLLLTPRNMTRVADQLAQMRGAAMKVGQLVSMDTGDLLPPELAKIMARLRDDAHFMPPSQLKQVLNAQWPKNWLRSFTKFDVRPIAAASIGQVHRAQLKDGRDLAIKVQYPGVAKSIDSDVSNVGALIKMSGLIPKGLDLRPYLAEARAQLHEETDYLREGKLLQQFGNLVNDMPQFIVPDLHHDWSTPDILAMNYVAGRPIEEAAYLPQVARNQIAHNVIDLTLQELFTFGVMQTDPNFANFLFDPDTGQVVLLDFGATRQIGATTSDQYRRLLRAGLADDPVALHDIARDIGFFGHDTADSHSNIIVGMIRQVFAAFRDKPIFDFDAKALSNDIQTEALKLADDGFVPPPLPVDVLLLQRKFGGMFLLANRLGAQLDVTEMIRKYVF